MLRRLVLLALLFGAVPAHAVRGVPTEGSVLTGIALPAASPAAPAQRVMDVRSTSDLMDSLGGVAGVIGKKCGDAEVLLWEDADGPDVAGGVLERLGAAGFALAELHRAPDADALSIYFTAKNREVETLGVFIIERRSLVLGWCRTNGAAAQLP